MKTISASRMICLCLGLLSVVVAAPCGAQPAAQPAPGEPPRVDLVIAPVEALPPQPSAAVSGTNVWVEAIVVELERSATRDFEKLIGFKLSPPDGRAILNPQEKEKVVAAIEEMDGARIIASLSVLTIPGQQAQSQHSEEVTYPTDYKFEERGITPSNWEKRDVGAVLNVTPVVGENKLIALILMPEVTALAGWKRIDGTEVAQPVFKTWNVTTTVHIPDGSSFVLKEAPLTPLLQSQAVDPDTANDPAVQKTWLTIISAKIVEVK